MMMAKSHLLVSKEDHFDSLMQNPAITLQATEVYKVSSNEHLVCHSPNCRPRIFVSRTRRIRLRSRKFKVLKKNETEGAFGNVYLALLAFSWFITVTSGWVTSLLTNS